MRRVVPVLSAVMLTAGCSLPFGQQATPSPSPSPSAVVSPSPTNFAQGLWVLSPLGIRMHQQPDVNATVTGGIPQGENVTATKFDGAKPGWYLVTYQGAQGWIAQSVPGSSPAVPLVTTHPQLSYSSLTAGYYFLYPSSWQVIDKALDVEADAPVPGAPGGASLAPSTAPSSANSPVTVDRLIVHEAKDVDSLGNTPTRPGSLFDNSQVEVYGITTQRVIYTLSSGGVEVDVKVKIAADRAVLLNFIGVNQKDVDTFNEIMYSFGVNLPGASPSPSP